MMGENGLLQGLSAGQEVRKEVSLIMQTGPGGGWCADAFVARSSMLLREERAGVEVGVVCVTP